MFELVVSCLHVLVLSADKMRQQLAFVAEVQRADSTRHLTSSTSRTVQLSLMTHQSFARRETLNAHRTHERRVRRLQYTTIVGRNHTMAFSVYRASLSCQLIRINEIYCMYIVMASDLKPLSVINILFKFADDTTFLVLENTDRDISVHLNTSVAGLKITT